MSQQDRFDRILASLHDATLDDAHWPATAGLIEDACGTKSSSLAIAHGESSAGLRDFLPQDLPPRAAPRISGAPVLGPLLPSGRTKLASRATAGQSVGSHPQPLHRTGVEDFSDVQRGGGHGQVPKRLGGASGRPGSIKHRLDPWRSHRTRRLAVRPDRDDREPVSPYPPIRARPSCAGRR